MRPRKSTTLFALALLISCGAASTILLSSVDSLRPNATLEEVLYVPSPKVLKRASLGYTGFLADIYWTRVVQYYGGKLQNARPRFELLAPLLNITTQLDPHLIAAYRFGGTFLVQKPPTGAGDPAKAAQLVSYGIENNPDDWHLYYSLGYIYYDAKDYHAASDAFERGSRLPNTHPFLKVLAAQMAQHGGDLETARLLWTTTYQTSKDKNIRANAAAHLRAVQVDEEVPQLEHVIERYRERTGRFPSSFAELAGAGVIPGIPLDPLGKPFKLLAGGRVVLRDPDDFPFVQKGLPPDYVAPLGVKILPDR